MLKGFIDGISFEGSIPVTLLQASPLVGREHEEVGGQVTAVDDDGLLGMTHQHSIDAMTYVWQFDGGYAVYRPTGEDQSPSLLVQLLFQNHICIHIDFL